VYAESDADSPNPTDSVVMPSAPNSGTTARADLVSASLSSDGDSVDYTFSTPVVIENTSDFFVDTSDTGDLYSDCGSCGTPSLISPTVVQVSFGQSLSSIDEYAVLAGADAGAVEPQANPSGDYENYYEGVPIGGNAGAFARGFTTGADVFGVVFNKAAGAVTVDLDQRANYVDTSEICLLNSAGDEVANPNPVSASIPTQAAGPEALTLQFVGGPTGPVAEASMISIGCNAPDYVDPTTDAFQTPLYDSGASNNNEDANSVAQIVAPVGSATRLHAYRPAARSAKKVSKSRGTRQKAASHRKVRRGGKA
jgi:hypothetical protein